MTTDKHLGILWFFLFGICIGLVLLEKPLVLILVGLIFCCVGIIWEKTEKLKN